MYFERLDQKTQCAIVAVHSRMKQPGKEMRCVHSVLRERLMGKILNEWHNVTGLEHWEFLYSLDAIMGAWIDWRKAGTVTKQDWYDKNSDTPLFPSRTAAEVAAAPVASHTLGQHVDVKA